MAGSPTQGLTASNRPHPRLSLLPAPSPAILVAVTFSIRTKLFLTLLTASSLAVAGMHAFMAWSFNNGLMELAEGRQQERLEQIADRLIERYRRDGGWQEIAADKGIWISILTGFDQPEDLPGRGPPNWAPGSGPRRHQARIMRHRFEDPGVWPPTPTVERARQPDGPPLPLEMRLMLLDSDGAPIQAQPALLPGTPRFPLRLEEKRIGELALIQGPFLPESGELRFQESQGQALLLIALAMVLLSALFAFPLAHRLAKPVRGFQITARRLASGDYAARAESHGDDELGRLGSDLNALAQTLEANEQARRRWMADISHELRTPLALLRAEIEAAQDGVRPLDARTLEALHGDTLRLGRLVDDLHELSMTDLGALSYRKADTDILEILAADLDAFRPRFAAAGLGLSLHNPLGEPLILWADGHRLSQLFRNLLHNSLQYTDPGGELRILMALTPSDLFIDFQDTAPGVPETALDHLFDRLYRVEASRSRNSGGAGLGLAIAHNIAEAHGGDISARHSPLGGLWVHLRLPLQGATL
ncbi:MAG: ATP-binding protein [Chromatiaceae bacterium]